MSLPVKNSQGKVFYGMHFYPGVAEYAEPGKNPFRIFINEDTIRTMNPSFAGRPIFVEHVDEVEDNLDELRTMADGWVVKSFYNAADGKTWAEFIVVSERGLKAIERGYKLSNTYVPERFGKGGLWNGVSYEREVTAGKHEHLAIVKLPRYEESQILTPEEFKLYNEGKEIELKRLANSKEERGNNPMKLNLFKRAKVENSADIEGMSVTLPKSGEERTIVQLVNEADAAIEKAKEPRMANAEDMYMNGETKMSVGEMAKAYNAMKAEMDAMKANAGGDAAKDEHADIESMDNEDDGDMDAALDNEEDDSKKDDKDVEGKKKNAADKKAEADQAKADQLAADKAKKRENFEKLKNAHKSASDEVATVELMQDQVERGRARYGS